MRSLTRGDRMAAAPHRLRYAEVGATQTEALGPLLVDRARTLAPEVRSSTINTRAEPAFADV